MNCKTHTFESLDSANLLRSQLREFGYSELKYMQLPSRSPCQDRPTPNPDPVRDRDANTSAIAQPLAVPTGHTEQGLSLPRFFPVYQCPSLPAPAKLRVSLLYSLTSFWPQKPALPWTMSARLMRGAEGRSTRYSVTMIAMLIIY